LGIVGDVSDGTYEKWSKGSKPESHSNQID